MGIGRIELSEHRRFFIDKHTVLDYWFKLKCFLNLQTLHSGYGRPLRGLEYFSGKKAEKTMA